MKPFVIIFGLLIISCFYQNPKSPCEAALNQEIDIKIGQEVLIKGTPLRLKFVSVLEDSRCPKGEQCITAGNGKIEIAVKRSDNETKLELNTARGPQQAALDSYEVKLVDLSPYPKRNHPIEKADYVARIIVGSTSS